MHSIQSSIQHHRAWGTVVYAGGYKGLCKLHDQIVQGEEACVSQAIRYSYFNERDSGTLPQEDFPTLDSYH